MHKLNLSLIILLISAGLSTSQQIASQTVEFKFTTWNTEWLSCSLYGPANDELQINNVVSVIKRINPDVIALQEVGTSSTYATVDTLVRRLGVEWAGSIVTSNADNCGQNQGLIYKKAKVQLVSASMIRDGGSSYDWSSGRYPVLYNVNLLVGGNVVPVSVINIHAKAMSDAASYTRRKNASQSLKTLLDGSAYNTRKIVLLGDFNDYLVGTQCSTCQPAESPYKNFMDDTQNYKGLSSTLYDPAYGSAVIDHIVISNELSDNYKPNTITREVTATQSITNYRNTTSDHTPVSASFGITAGTPLPQCESMVYSETFYQSLGDFVPYSVNGTQNWQWRQNYGACISGYANSVNNPNEDWLISPAFDLSGSSQATLTFSHALNYSATESDKINNHTLWASTNCNDGIPANATWTQLAIPVMPAGNNWTYINSGNIQLPAQLMQKNVRFAFKYISSATVASTWEIKELNFNAECIETNVPTQMIKPQYTVHVSDKRINIRNQQPASVTVYDLTGRVLFSLDAVRDIQIPVYQPGIYIVRIGNEVSKVIVN